MISALPTFLGSVRSPTVPCVFVVCVFFCLKEINLTLHFNLLYISAICGGYPHEFRPLNPAFYLPFPVFMTVLVSLWAFMYYSVCFFISVGIFFINGGVLYHCGHIIYYRGVFILQWAFLY
jgi:hypothetical protein